MQPGNEVFATPVVHLGEVAGVAETLVRGLRGERVTAQRLDLPAPMPDSSLLVKGLTIAPRVAAAKRIRRKIGEKHAIAHVHYATSGIWFIGTHPLVVHCHGTDVRGAQGVQRRILGRVFGAADLVIAATPDLLAYLPAGAEYLPNPVDIEAFSPSIPASSAPFDVLIFSALTDIKGAKQILEVAEWIMELRPGTTIRAIRHGVHSDSFERAGVDMAPYMSSDELPGFINEHKVVLGQRKLGVAGTSELQAIACGRPLAMPVDPLVDPGLLPPGINARDPREAAGSVVALLEDTVDLDRASEVARSWVVGNHGLSAVTDRLMGMYLSL